MINLRAFTNPRPNGARGIRYGLVVLIWGVIALGPLGVLVFDLLLSPFDTANIAVLVFGQRSFTLFLKSVAIAGTVSLCSMALAIALARWSRGANSRAARWLAWLPLTLVLVPPYVHATAWMTFTGKVGAALGMGGLHGVAGAIWIQMAAFFPISLAFAFAAFCMTDRQQIEAARVFSGDWAVFRAIEWPQILPAAGIGAALVFILSIADFSVPSLTQVEVYALEAFVEYSIAADSLASFIVALPLLVVCVGTILIVAVPIQRLGITFSLPPRRRGNPVSPEAPSLQALGLVARVFAALQVAVPVFMLTAGAYPFAGIQKIIVLNTGVIFSSLTTASLAAGISVLLALVLVPLLTTVPRLTLVLIPLAVPASLTGIGLIQLWTLPGFEVLYNTAAMPVLAAIAQFAPVAILALYVQSNRCDPILSDAAHLFRGNGPAVWFRILLPLWWPGLAVGFFGVFGLTLAELTASLLVSPPGQQMLTAKIFSLLHYGASQQVAILCLVILAASMLLMGGIFLSVLSLKKQRRSQSHDRT